MTANNGVATIQHSGLVLDDERVALLRKTFANDAPALEFEMFVALCNRTGLDPFAKQAYLIKRGGRWTPQTSIDGYRLIADRTDNYAGSDEPVYDIEDTDHPNKATVTVYKMVKGQRCAFSASARWSEYAVSFKGELSEFWRRMPYLMLAKCAESLALRKAFPQELSGLYTREEMMQADDEPTIDIAEAEYVNMDTGEIPTNDTESPADEFLRGIREATTLARLQEIGGKLRDSGLANDEIRHAWKQRLDELNGNIPQPELIAAAADPDRFLN